MKLSLVSTFWIRLALLAAALAGSAYGYVTFSELPKFTSSTVDLRCRMNTSPVYPDGKTPNQVAQRAVLLWNGYLGRLQFTASTGSPGSAENNGRNEIWAASKVYGEEFPDGVLASTVLLTSADKRTRSDSDIIVNTAYTWSSYQGSLQYGTFDLGRVLAHEVGHVVGLGHPDEAGQSVDALMNSMVSHVDTLTDDDQSGAAALYGDGPLTHPVKITRQPVGGSFYEGEYVSLWVEAESSSYLSYQWYKDGVALPSAIGSALSFYSYTKENAGRYTVTVTNGYGKRATSTAAVLTVKPPVPPSITQDLTDLTLDEGKSATLDVEVLSYTPCTYAWYKNGVFMPGWTTPFLSLYDSRPEQSGRYQVKITNATGTVSSRIALIVVNPAPVPAITGGQPEVGVPLGATLSLTFNITSIHTTATQWFKDGTPLVGYSDVPLTKTMSPSDEGIYWLRISNAAGTTESPHTIVRALPGAAPTISSPTTTQYCTQGSSVTLSPSITAPGLREGVSYQWSKDGVPLLGATGASLTLSNFDAAQTGDYELTVLTMSGATTSSIIRVRLRATTTQRSACVQDGVLHCIDPTGLIIERWRLSDGTQLSSVGLRSRASGIAPHPRGVVVTQREGPPCLIETGASEPIPFTTVTINGGTVLIWKVAKGYVMRDTQRTLHFFLQDGTRSATLYTPDYPIDLVEVPSTEGLLSISGDGYVRLLSTFGAPKLEGYLPILSTSSRGLWLDASGKYAITSSGIVYNALNYTLESQLDRQITDMIPLPDGRNLLLSEGKLLRLSASLAIEDWREAPANAANLFRVGDTLHVLTVDDNNKRSVVQVALSVGFATGVPAQESLAASAVAPQEWEQLLPPNFTAVTPAGLVCEVVKPRGILNLWSPTTKSVVASLRLHGNPIAIAYAPGTGTLVLSYDDRLVSRVDLSTDALVERAWFWSSVGALPITASGDLVILEGSATNYWVSYKSHQICNTRTNTVGSLLNQPNRTASRVGNAFNATSGVWIEWLYSELISHPLSADGSQLSYNTQTSKPLPTEVVIPWTAINPFIAPDATATRVLTSSGVVVRVADATVLGTLPFAPSLATWVGDSLCCARNGLRSSSLEFRDISGKALVQAIPLDFVVRALNTLPDGRVVAIGERHGVSVHALVSSDFGTAETFSPTLPSRLVNMSVQAVVGEGDDILVPGLVVEGTKPKPVLVRTIGPGLQAFGVKDTLASPQMELFRMQDGAGTRLGLCNAGSARQSVTSALGYSLGAFDVGPNSQDAAMGALLSEGLFTTQASSNNPVATQRTGKALVEVYDAAPLTPGSQLVNMSARCRIPPETPAIGGFVIQGTKPMTVLIRAVGPKLTDYKVTGVLADPKLTLFSGQTVVATNNDWSADATKAEALRQAFTDTGAFALTEGSKDAALLVTLEPGAYTVWMESADGTSGVSLLELYVVEAKD